MTDNNSTSDKLQARFERSFGGHRIHALPPKGGTRVFNPSTGSSGWVDSARPWMGKQPGCNFYFSPAVVKSGSGTSNTKDDMQESLFVWADLDPRPGQPLDAERAAMLEMLTDEISAPLPTFIVDSGRGLWAFWKLKSPHKFDGRDGDATRVFEAVLRGLGNAFGDYGDRSVKNTNRIARLPGSINTKTGGLAKVVAFNPVSYSLDGLPSIVVERRPRRSGDDAEPIPLDLFKRMLAATPYTGGPEGMTDRTSYDGWLQIMMAFHEAAGGDCGDYLAAVIDWCQNDPNAKESWTAEKIQAHWESFDSGAAGGIRRGTWTTLLQSFDGTDDLISEATPGDDAPTEFADEPPEPVKPMGDASVIEREKQARAQDIADGIKKPLKYQRRKVVFNQFNLTQSLYDATMAIRADKVHDPVFRRGPMLSRLNQAVTPRDLEVKNVKRKRGALMITTIVPDYMKLRLDQAGTYHVKVKEKAAKVKGKPLPKTKSEPQERTDGNI